MANERCLVVAVEDFSTATTVAAAAAHLAVEQGVTTVLLVHVLNQHPLIHGLLNLGGPASQATEAPTDGELVLNLAERALRAELATLGRAAPSISHYLTAGEPATIIAGAARDCGADAILVGARRPHAFGLLHPDVRSTLAAHAPCPVHVAMLQEPSSH
jgi:nucleotide-binding universal stress UspA family protein